MGRRWMVISSALATLIVSAEARAQEGMQDGKTALDECIVAAERKDEKVALASASRAERIFASVQSRKEQEAEALVGQARVLSQCRIPFANMMAMGALAERSTELLERALAIDSMHAVGRYILAMNAYHSPAFLNRLGEAVTQLEWLVRVFGVRTDVGVMPAVYITLGDAYERQDRMADAQRTWRRGAELFPSNEMLAARAAKHVEQEATVASAPSTRAVYALAPLSVEAGSYSMDDPRSATSLSKTEVYTTPGGTADLLQVFQTMPGTTRVSEGSDLYVRGGDPAETPVFVDGARLMYAGSFESLDGGVFGVLDPSVLSKAYFSSGGFSVRYGNALSGILDVTTDGRPDARSWRAGLNLATAGATVRTPLGPRGGAWLSLQGTETTAMLKLHGRSADYENSPRGLQAIGGASFQVAHGIDLKATGLVAGDDMRIIVDAMNYTGALSTDGSTRLGSLALSALSDDGRSNLRVSVSASTRDNSFALGVLDWQRSDRTAAVRMEGEHAAHAGMRLRAGAEAARMDALEAGVIPTGESLAPGSPVARLDAGRNAVHHVGAFAETELRLAEPAALVIGIRTDRLPGEAGWTIDPRAGIALRVGDWTLRGGAGVFQQGRWRTRYVQPDGGRPVGIPTRARHLVLGAQREGAVDVRIEGFHKAYDEYEHSGEGQQVESGTATGVDALVRWRGTELNGWVSYSFIDSDVTLADGSSVPSLNDVTHTLTAVARRPVGRNWEVGSTLRLGSGRPLTPVLGADPEEPAAPLYGALHSERMPGYLRLDGRLTRLQPVADGLMIFYIEGLNLLDHRNVMAYTYDASYNRRRPVDSFFSYRTLVFGVEAQF